MWINGTFGAGKTTTGTLLALRDPRLRVFDPEWVGYLLASNLSNDPGDQAVSDFQHYESWRRLVPVVADEVVRVTGQSLVATQSVLDEGYWAELTAGSAALGHEVLHVVVEADPEVLAGRIEADEVESGARQWRLDHLTTYAETRGWMTHSADLVVDSTHLTPAQVTDRVWSVVAEALATAST